MITPDYLFSGFIGAVIGALLGGFATAWGSYLFTKKHTKELEDKKIKNFAGAIYTELTALKERYMKIAGNLIEQTNIENELPLVGILSTDQNYFIVFDNLSSDLFGLLDIEMAKNVIDAYINTKALFDDLEFILKMQEDVDGYAGNDEKLLEMNGVPDPTSLAFRKENPVFAKLDEYAGLSINSFDKLPVTKTGIEYVSTPGHSPGSTCFIPSGTDIIFTGDHILEKITPNISYYDGVTDFLGHYIDSLKKTALLPINNAYPGHGVPFSNVKGRIESLLSHHTTRMEEIRNIINGKMITAYDIACKMTWSRGRHLDSMNHMEKKFAIGEAISHLRHMETIGMCSTVEKNGLILYKN